MLTPPLKSIQEAVAFWRTRREEARAHREYIRDWNEAQLEEEQRQQAVADALEEVQRLAVLEQVEKLISWVAEGLRLAHASTPLHLDYLGHPVESYVYATLEGTILAGHKGNPILIPSLNLVALQKLEYLLRAASDEVTQKVLEYESRKGEKKSIFS